ncbi:titin-like [Aphidius gifuensis]|uniref:titin-like n=1 Tax=Aphidius gifuensis TaxID=684658 RepID=UPI001CDCCBC8|nr:titin-like [Aphidius gifuensis]
MTSFYEMWLTPTKTIMSYENTTHLCIILHKYQKKRILHEVVASDNPTIRTDYHTDAGIGTSHNEKFELKKLIKRTEKVSNEKINLNEGSIDCQTVPWRKNRAVDFSCPMILATCGKAKEDAVKYTLKKFQQGKNKNTSKKTSWTENIVLKTVPQTRKERIHEKFQVVMPLSTTIQEIISENVTPVQQTISDVVQDKKQISSSFSKIKYNLTSNSEIIPSHVNQITNVSCEKSETPYVGVESSFADFTKSQQVTPQSKKDLNVIEKNEHTPCSEEKISRKKSKKIKPKFLEEPIEHIKLNPVTINKNSSRTISPETSKIENMFIKQKKDRSVEHSVEKISSVSDNIPKSKDKKLRSMETNFYLPIDKHRDSDGSSVSKIEKLQSTKQEEMNARVVMKEKKISSALKAPVEEERSKDNVFGESSELKSKIKFPEPAQQQSSTPSNISFEKPIPDTLEVKSEDTENETKKYCNWIVKSEKNNNIRSMKHQLEIKPNGEKRETLTEFPELSNNDQKFKNQKSTTEDNVMENIKLDIQPKIADNTADMTMAEYNEPSKKIYKQSIKIKSHAADNLKELKNRKQGISGQESSANKVENGKQKSIISEKKEQILEPVELDDNTEVMKIQDIVPVKNILEEKMLKRDKPTTEVEKVSVDIMEGIENEEEHLYEKSKKRIIKKKEPEEKSIQNIELTKNTRQKSTKKRPNEKSIEQNEYQNESSIHLVHLTKLESKSQCKTEMIQVLTDTNNPEQMREIEKKMAQSEVVNDSLITKQPSILRPAKTTENNTSTDEIGIIHSLKEELSFLEKHGTLIDESLKENEEKIDDFGPNKLTLANAGDNLEELHLEHVHNIQKGLEDSEGVAPHFVEPLIPMVTNKKKSVILECTVLGVPMPEIKWYREECEMINNKNTAITYNPRTGKAKLTIFSLRSIDETVYRVCATNNLGQAECRTNIVMDNDGLSLEPEVLRAPKITKPLPALVAEKQQTITLLVEFESQLPFEAKWIWNGNEINLCGKFCMTLFEKSAQLTINNIEKKDSGKYEFRIQNLKGEARSSGTITVADHIDVSKTLVDKPKAPHFKEIIEPQLVFLNEVLIIEANAESFPTASFLWFHKESPLKPSSDVRIVTKNNRSVIFIEKAKPEHAGTYTCRAENVAGSVTCTARVDLIETNWKEVEGFTPPTFILPLSSVHVMDGQSVDLTCIVKGEPIPKIQWYHNGKPVQERKEIVLLQDSKGVCNLAISEVFPEDAGQYDCRATNILGEEKCSTSLFVEAYEYVPDLEISSVTMMPMSEARSSSEDDLSSLKAFSQSGVEMKACAPEIIKKLPPLLTVIDRNATRLEVQVKGNPRPSAKWYKDGLEIKTSREFQVEELKDGTFCLVIAETYPDDTGEIVFKAFNPLGVSTTTTFLSVKGILGTKDYRKPEWVTQMEETQELEKASQQIPRFIREITDAYVQNGEKIVFEVIFAGRPAPDCVWYKNDKLIMNTKNIIIKLFEKEYKSNLTIYHTTSEDEATYVCKITSGIGSAKTQAKLHVITGTSAKPEDGSEFGKEIEIKKKNKKIKSNKIKEMKLMKGSQLDDNQRNIKLQALEETIVKQQFHDIEVTDSLQFEPMESIDVFTAKSYKDIDFSTDVVPSVVESTTTLTTLRETKNLDKQINTEKSIVQSVGLITDSFSVIKDSYRKLSVEKIIDLSAPIDGNIEPKVVNKSSAEICRGFQELKETKSKINVMKIANNVEKDNNEVIQENLRRNKTGKLNDLSEVVVEDILRENSNNLLHAVEKTIRLLDVKEFGKAEVPLRELATIGYLVRQGVSENQINESLYRTNQFPALRTPDSQNALVQLVEREGYGSLITQVLTEETTTDESIVAATVGFRAFMRMVELQHTTVEELILNFAPEDFRPRAWEVAEITEGNFEDFEADMVTTELLTGVFPIKTEEEIETMAIQDIQKFKDA